MYNEVVGSYGSLVIFSVILIHGCCLGPEVAGLYLAAERLLWPITQCKP